MVGNASHNGSIQSEFGEPVLCNFDAAARFRHPSTQNCHLRDRQTGIVSNNNHASVRKDAFEVRYQILFFGSFHLLFSKAPKSLDASGVKQQLAPSFHRWQMPLVRVPRGGAPHDQRSLACPGFEPMHEIEPKNDITNLLSPPSIAGGSTDPLSQPSNAWLTPTVSDRMKT
jgi:hypothetical protein